MGVPSFFNWLVNRFNRTMLHAKYPHGRMKHLFLDFNCAIHPAVKADATMKVSEMYAAVSKYLDSIVEYADPSDTLYIAIDGVAPRAKMEQQRARRYKSIKEGKMIRRIKEKHKEPVRDESIDFNMISPGTEFMSHLSDYLIEYLNAKKKSEWKHLDIIFSDATVPGEGEHKIMDYIRSKPGIDKIGIYGLDSDLIFLTGINCPKETVLVRESVQFGKRSDEMGDYTYLSMSSLLDSIVSVLSPIVSFEELEGLKIFNDLQFQVPENPKTKFYRGTAQDDHRLFMDYVFICFLLGNDFIPHLPSLKIREGGLNSVVQAYKVISWKYGKYLVAEDGVTVDFSMFKSLLYELSMIEDEFLQNYNDNRRHRIKRFNYTLKGLNPVDRELKEMEYIENKYDDMIKMGEPGWKIRYYQHHFNIPYRHKDKFRSDILPICREFMKGMKWTLLYYQGQHGNWSWHYPYIEGPTVQDLYDNVDKTNPNSLSFNDDKPVAPLVQLMCILPPESHKLLPEKIGQVMINRSSKLHTMYPLKVEVSLVGKKYLWECHPRLPDADIKMITQVVDRLYELEYCKVPHIVRRNSLGTVRCF